MHLRKSEICIQYASKIGTNVLCKLCINWAWWENKLQVYLLHTFYCIYTSFSFIDSGDTELFLSLETTVISSLKQEPAEWRRSYGRAIKSIQISGTFIPFSEEKLPVEGDWNIIDQPVFHTYWTQCSVSIFFLQDR